MADNHGNGGAHYRPTESKYKGGAHERYVTYDLEQNTRGGGTALYPKVKRVYIAGDIQEWTVGDFTKKSGKEVHGVRIVYRQTRAGYRRRSFSARRGATAYQVEETQVRPAAQKFTQVIEVPDGARNIRFHQGKLPARYREALQSVA